MARTGKYYTCVSRSADSRTEFMKPYSNGNNPYAVN